MMDSRFEGDRYRSSLWRGAVVAVIGVVAYLGWTACSSEAEVIANPDQGGDSGIQTDGLILCKNGQFRCEGTVAKLCDGKGGYTKTDDCSTSGRSCTETFGCTLCVGGTGTCANGQAKMCEFDGSGYRTFECDTAQGMVCEADGCKGACAPAELHNTYYGCDFYPTVTLNPVWSGFDFAVAVANAAATDAKVSVTRGGNTVASRTIASKSIDTIVLPWVAELKQGDQNACMVPPDPGVTTLAKGGAYRLRTNVPVTVYQFNALSYKFDPKPAGCPTGKDCGGGVIGDCLSYTNDASLLLPVNTWSRDYAVMAWPSEADRAGFAAITATVDNTSVEVHGVGEFAAGAGVSATGTGTVTLNAGDVLQIVARHDPAKGMFGSDLSGTRIKATRPIQVIGGHSCGNVPEPTTLACDHLEQVMFPIEALGDDYLVTYPAVPAASAPHVVRVLAVAEHTNVIVEPSSVAPPTTLEPGKAVLEIKNVTKDIRIHTDDGKAIMVVQYMQGEDSVPNQTGDPSMGISIPTAQFRTQYIFIAPKTYDSNFVNVIAPTGVDVRLDGKSIPSSEFSVIAGSGFSVARIQLSTDEHHVAESSIPFGIMVYGYGQYTSYMYPGGLDLKRIATVPPIIY